MSYFGCSKLVCGAIWSRLLSRRLLCGNGFEPRHLLWTLFYLKVKGTEHPMAGTCRCDEKTLRKWAWIGIDLLGELNLVRRVVGRWFGSRRRSSSF